MMHVQFDATLPAQCTCVVVNPPDRRGEGREAVSEHEGFRAHWRIFIATGSQAVTSYSFIERLLSSLTPQAATGFCVSTYDGVALSYNDVPTVTAAGSQIIPFLAEDDQSPKPLSDDWPIVGYSGR